MTTHAVAAATPLPSASTPNGTSPPPGTGPSAGPAPTASTGSTTPATPAPVTHLSDNAAALVLVLGVVFVLLAGLLVIRGRTAVLRLQAGNAQVGAGQVAHPDGTIVRSWLSVALVGGLLILSVLSFRIDDPTLRSTLIGGLVASSSAAVAFYFSGKNADQARHDVLNAAGKPVAVPNLIGMGVEQVNQALAPVALAARLFPADPGAGDRVSAQDPVANSQAQTGQVITVTFTAPPPAGAGAGAGAGAAGGGGAAGAGAGAGDDPPGGS